MRYCFGSVNQGVQMNPDTQQVGGTHYTDMSVQPWDVMKSVLTPKEFQGYLKGNIIKYSMRNGKKENSDDLGKALHYMHKLEQTLNDYND